MPFQEIARALGCPRYHDEQVMLFDGDCMSLMQRLPEGSIDLTVTSPPYNIGKAYERPLPLEDYLAWMEGWIKHVHRLTKPSGAFWLNLGYLAIEGRAKALPITYLMWDRIPFFLMQEVVWNYGAGVAAKKFFSPRNEKF
jgi:adenine-specific DNA-methyltransferase